MRALIACLFAAACATASIAPPARLVGCWANRDVGFVSMRWSSDADRPGAMRGTRLDYRQVGGPIRTRFALDPSGDGYSLCELDPQGAAALRCWQVAQGDGGSLEGGRAFLDLHADRLRITIVGDGPERVIFYGRRERCG
jgi:hypothetical protein